MTATGSATIGSMAAYALVRFRFMGRDSLSLSTLAVRMIPPAVLLVPVFGLMIGAAFFGERLEVVQAVGVVLVLIGILLVQRRAASS